MFLTFKDRPSSSPYIERVWCSHTHTGGVFYSMAEGSLELVVTQLAGSCRVTLRGPVTRAAPIVCPANGEWVAIRFRVGTHFAQRPTALLMDHNDIDFPTVRDKRFWFAGARWEIPTFENAEGFVQKLAREGAIAIDPTVPATIEGGRPVLSRRSVQRHFLRVTGMTHALFRQIQRARYAAKLLCGGTSILDVVHSAGYFDQAHLTRSLTRLVGPTPTAILRNEVQLSFSYEHEPAPAPAPAPQG
jgi:hypothetical protein